MSSATPAEFEVESILSHRVRLGKTSYLVKWAGFPDSENTWEPAENLSKTTIDEYTATLDASGKPPKRPNATETKEVASRIESINSATLSDGGVKFNVRMGDGQRKVFSRKDLREQSPELLIRFIEELVK
jgi:hypothetical protein